MLFPPETASGAGSAGVPTPAVTPAAGGAAAPPATTAPAAGTSDAKPFTTPADDLQARYDELNAKAKQWEEFGKPEDVREAIAWARQRAAEIQAGKLTYAQQQEQKRQESTVDPFEKWDELDPRQQAALLREDARRAALSAREELLAELKKPLEESTRVAQTQQQIFMQAARLSAETGVPFDEAVQEATRLASLSTPELLKLAYENKLSPKRQQQLIDQKVQEALANAEQERERKEAEALLVRSGAKFFREPTSLAERRSQGDKKISEVIRRETRRVAMGD